MGGDLEHGVGGSVNDQVPGLHMLVAVGSNDLRAGPGGVGKDASSRGRLEGLQHLIGEAVGIGRQRVRRHDARNLPVADGGILAHGAFRQLAVSAGGSFHLAQEVQAVDVAEAALSHIGNVQLGRSGAGAQGVDPHIAKTLRIRHGAAAAGIQYK